MNRSFLIFLRWVALPILVVVQVVGIAKFYPRCEDSILYLLILYICVYALNEAYRWIINKYNDELW